MADDEAQGPEDTSWWSADKRADASLPSAPFDEPLIWPESLPWGDVEAAGPGVLPPPLVGADLDADLLFAEVAAPSGPESHPDIDARWPKGDAGSEPDPEATIAHVRPLAGLGGGGGLPATAAYAPSHGPADPPVGEAPLEPLPQSIWSYEARPPEELLGMAALPAPAVYAEAEHTGRPRWRRPDIRPGNAAVIALISVVSLVLLGMFLSVRARNNDLPTDSSQPRTPADQIAVNGPLNTVPSTTTVTTTAPAIDIAGLVPAADVPAAAAGTGATAATTVPATRSTTPTATAATTTPATQPTATTAAPPPTTEAPTVTSTPDDTAPPTTKRTVPLPTFPTYTVPTIVIPTFPPGTLRR